MSATDPLEAYDDAVARWNNRENENENATFDSILAEELGSTS